MKFSFQKVEQINNHSFDLIQVNQKKNIINSNTYDIKGKFVRTKKYNYE